jgi:hypothetical protein
MAAVGLHILAEEVMDDLIEAFNGESKGGAQ